MVYVETRAIRLRFYGLMRKAYDTAHAHRNLLSNWF
jgi:hypothetical protein